MRFLTFCISLASLLLFVTAQFDLQDYGVIIDSKHKQKFLWGTYKPNLYFAMKNRRNTSDVFGLMWYGSEDSDFRAQGGMTKRLRHNCKMEDQLNYRWETHNGIDYGSQILEDKANQIIMNTKFVKHYYNETQSWSVYIKGEKSNTNNKKTSIFLYTSMENFEVSDKSFFNTSSLDLNNYNFRFSANEKGNQKYHYDISLGKDTKLVSKSFQKYRKRYNETWRVKRFVLEDLEPIENTLNRKNKTYEYINFNTNHKIETPNIVVIQLVFESSFEIIINFCEKENKDNVPLNLLDIFETKQNEFNKKFDEVYWSRLNLDHFNKLPVSEESQKLMLREMSQQALSNILGGIGYFWGAIKINLEETQDKYHKGFRYAVESKGLFTATPSRSYFARGFLWDEGFHNIIISQWDVNISLDILNSWLSTMSATGWMAREQIRGAEAEAQVPSKFITQDKQIANPPTLIFPLENILQFYKYHSEGNNLKTMKAFLKKCFDKFGSWFEWFENYQKAPDRRSYQWYGRNSEHNLASGLDDYPRGMSPNIHERHLDLTIWVMQLVKTLRNISELFDFELVSYFDKLYQKMLQEMDKNFLDKENGVYSDYLGPQFKLIKSDNYKRPVPPYLWRGDGRCGNEAPNPLGQPSECNPYSDAPCCSEFGWCGASPNHCKCEKCSKAEKLENREAFRDKQNIFNPHIGYVNLYPIFFGLIKADHPSFKNTLALLSSEDELLSNFGIRSLSKSDMLYHTGEDYWRGNIWMNLNFLTLRGLYKHYKDNQEAMRVYKIIRSNLIKNVFTQWKKERTFYEQYSDRDGQGLKARPFNGWTSLILNIITERYDS